MFGQPGRAIILADTATTALTGELISDQDKLAVFSASRLVAGWTGYAPSRPDGPRQRIKDGLAGLGVPDEQSAILKSLPLVLREMHRENIDWLQAGRETMIKARAAIVLIVSYWDERRSEAVMLMAVSEAMDGLAAYDLIRVSHYMSTDGQQDSPTFLRETFGRDINPADPAQFDPRKDGLKLLERQRRLPPPAWSYGHYSIGGRATLTTIDRDGVHVETLKDWLDPIGRKIQPDRPRVPFALLRKIGRQP
jgi:hypothetical protein